MGNTTEGIGRLIAEEVLLQAERQLLRNRDQPPQRAKEQSEQPSSPPLSHNDKAVSSVLLTLLDEQLDASAIASQKQSADSAAAQLRNGETPSAPNRIAAQYAETEAAFRPDKPVDEKTPIPLGQPNPQAMASSPELRMMMESAFATAAARLQGGVNTGLDGAQKQRPGVMPDLTPLMRIGTGIFAAAVFVMVIAAIFSR